MKQIRIIAPADSWKPEKEEFYKSAVNRLQVAGYQVTFAPHVKSVAYLGTASSSERAKDFNEAFSDASVDIIIALHGGFSSNDILPHVDWDIVKNNPKPLVGYSDITVLCNAIFAKTGMKTYLGPNLSTLGLADLWEYTFDSLFEAINHNRPYLLKPSKSYIDDKQVYKTEPWLTVQDGTGEGILLGGNIQTLFLLQGTEFQSSFDEHFILAIEDDSLSKEYTLHGFARNIESILQLPNVRQNIRGILIGRFEKNSKVTNESLTKLLVSKDLLGIPIIANLDFGHTTPMATLPIGGTVKIEANSEIISVNFM